MWSHDSSESGKFGCCTSYQGSSAGLRNTHKTNIANLKIDMDSPNEETGFKALLACLSYLHKKQKEFG